MGDNMRRKKSISQGLRKGKRVRPSAGGLRRARAYFERACALHSRGDFANALTSYEAVLNEHDRHTDALLNAGLLCLQVRQPERAVEFLQKATQILPNHPIAQNSLGNAYRELGQLELALAAYRLATRVDATYLNAQVNLGSALQKSGDPEQAVLIFASVLERHEAELGAYDAAEIWSAYGGVLLDTGEVVAAMEAQHKALGLEPRLVAAWNELGLTQADSGEFAKAQESYQQALSIDPAYTKAYLNLSKTRRFSEADEALCQTMEKWLQRSDLANDSRSDLHFALGKIYDDREHYETAFSHYRQGNEAHLGRYDPEHALAELDTLRYTLTESWINAHRKDGHPSTRPVFIVGMPRSGTSLVEQIIASHPEAFGAGELSDISRLTQASLSSGVSYPEGVAEISPSALYSVAQKYLQALDCRDDTAFRVTDKMPGNFRYIGFIRALFPNAKLVYCRRHPLDVCLSIYFRHFINGHHYAYDLRHLATEYAIHQQLMAHWHEVLPGVIHEVEYEKLVSDQEAQSRLLLAHLGLSWHESCLNFHQASRTVRTASSWQVRQPIYDRSIGRWRHYAPFLRELRETLEAFGLLIA